MNPIHYFFPQATLADIASGQRLNLAPGGLLAAAGLADVLADVADTDSVSVFEFNGAGPGGLSGVYLCPLAGKEPPMRAGYYRDHQTWRRSIGGRVWLGTDNEFPPRPIDLERTRPLRGYVLHTTKGALHVPILRSPRGISSLPEEWGYDDAGQFTKSVRDEYRALWDESAEVWDVIIARRDGAKIDCPRGLELCLRILALNYRYGRHEQNLLHWVDSENWTDILALAVDAPAIEHYTAAMQPPDTPGAEKKTTATIPPPSSNASPGVQVCDPITAPAAANCGSPAKSENATAP